MADPNQEIEMTRINPDSQEREDLEIDRNQGSKLHDWVNQASSQEPGKFASNFLEEVGGYSSKHIQQHLDQQDSQGYTPVQKLVKEYPSHARELFASINNPPNSLSDQAKKGVESLKSCDWHQQKVGQDNPNDKGMTVAGLMCKHGNAELVGTFSEFSKNNKRGYSYLRQQDDNGYYPVHYAANRKEAHGDIEGANIINKLAKEKKLDPNQKSQNGTTPLETAIQAGNKDAVDALLDNKAKVFDTSALNAPFSSAIEKSLQQGHTNITDSLIGNAAKHNPKQLQNFLEGDITDRPGTLKHKKQLVDKAVEELKGQRHQVDQQTVHKRYQEIFDQALQKSKEQNAAEEKQPYNDLAQEAANQQINRKNTISDDYDKKGYKNLNKLNKKIVKDELENENYPAALNAANKITYNDKAKRNQFFKVLKDGFHKGHYDQVKQASDALSEAWPKDDEKEANKEANRFSIFARRDDNASNNKADNFLNYELGEIADKQAEKAKKNEQSRPLMKKTTRLEQANFHRQQQIKCHQLQAQHAAADSQAQVQLPQALESIVKAENQRRDNLDELGHQTQSEDRQFQQQMTNLYRQCAKQTMYKENGSLKPNSEVELDKVTNQFKNSLDQWQAKDENEQSKAQELKDSLDKVREDIANQQQEAHRSQQQRHRVSGQNNPMVNGNNGSGPPSCSATTQQSISLNQIQQFAGQTGFQAKVGNQDIQSLNKLPEEPTIEYYNSQNKKVFDHSIKKISDSQYEHKGSLQASQVSVDNIQSFVSYFANNMPEGPNGEKANMQISNELKKRELSDEEQDKALDKLQKVLGEDNKMDDKTKQDLKKGGMTMADYAWLEGKSQGLNVEGAQPNKAITDLCKKAQEPEHQKDEGQRLTIS